MEIKVIEHKKQWEDFLAGCFEKTFLQSWNWGEFHSSMGTQGKPGNKIWRFGFFEEGALIAVALVVKISARRGSFLLVPHGPVMKSEIAEIKYEVVKLLKEKLYGLAKKEKVDFLRISPIFKRTEENTAIFQKLGFRQAPLHYHPESSWKLYIKPSEEELFAGMRKTTRYLIKNALKNGDLEIIKSTNVADMNIFYDIHTPVAKLQNFTPFSVNYLSKEFLAFLPDNAISLFFIKYKGKYIAGAFEIFWSGIGFYHHAALLPEYHKLPASYLLQWEAIREARARGCEVYDFWGYADPVLDPKHPYAGPTLFKMGFGGYVDKYVKTQDFVISPKYWINYIIELSRKIKRGL
jgi:lipid II:glycine glycyltransferase (peptidoglycan interpeptide bridge formation enzyme)